MEKKRPFWISGIPGLDDGSREVSIVIVSKEIERSIPAYQADVDVFGTLAVLNDEEIKRYSDSKRFQDEWYGTGSYEGRRIEPWGSTGWYKVFHREEQRSWTVMRQYPDSAKPLPGDPLEFYVARCTVTGPAGQESADCQTYVFFDDVAVDFHMSAANLVLIDQVRTFLKAKVQSWKGSGVGGSRS